MRAVHGYLQPEADTRARRAFAAPLRLFMTMADDTHVLTARPRVRRRGRSHRMAPILRRNMPPGTSFERQAQSPGRSSPI